MKIPFRLFVILGSFLLTVLLYIDRACISAAKKDITGDLSLSNTDWGWVMAIFTLGYALLQAPSGQLADRYGPRRVITWIVSIWSVLTAVTGAAFNYTSLLIIRFLFGAGEAGCFPALTKVAFFWFPVKERGLITGINFSGSRIGAAFALPLVATMIVSVGWRMSFVIFGIVGVVFALIWWLLIKDKPEESKFVSEKERDYILSTRQKPAEKKSFLSYGRVLSEGNVWLAMTQYICSNFTFYFTLTWMFPYIAERFALPPIKTGLYAMLPLLGGALGNWLSGIIVDAIYKGGKSDLSRRLPAIIGFILAAVGMIMVTRVDSVTIAILFMTIAVMGADMTLPPSWSFCVDIGKDNSGLVSGTMNMAGNLGAFVTILAFPYLKKWTGSYEPFFYICAALSVIAIFAWFAMKPGKAIAGKTIQEAA